MAKFKLSDLAKLGGRAVLDSLEQQRQEEERLAREREREAKVEADRLARERAQAEREAKQEADRLARERERAAREVRRKAERLERERRRQEREAAREAARLEAERLRQQKAEERDARAQANRQGTSSTGGGTGAPAQTAAPPLDILVAPRGSAAHDAAEARADGAQTLAERKLFRALDRAAAYLNENGPTTVTLRLAAGSYTGKVNTGTWLMPKVDAPGSTLRIVGGWDDTWQHRAPFDRRSVLQVARDRTAPIFQLERESRLRVLVFSGLTLDAGASNTYGSGDNLQTGQTNAYELVAFSYLEVERLLIADNTFANAGHRVIETLVRAASAEAEIVVRNNLLLNNVLCWRAFSAKFRHQPKRYVFEHNSFILNWPRNPDRTTSNPGALEIGDKHAAGQLVLRGNLFAYNVGGAIHFGADDQEGPPMHLEDNLFWGNGALFDLDDPGKAAVVGKFNRSRAYIPLDPIDVEDNFDWQMSGNVVEDPGLRIQIHPFEGFSSAEKAQPRAASGPAASAADVDSGEADASVATAASFDAGDRDLSLDADDRDLSLDSDLSLDAGDSDLSLGSDLSLDSDLSLGGDLGLDGALGLGDDSDVSLGVDDSLFEDLSFGGGGPETYHVAGFARRLYLDAPESPFPRHESARKYGAHPDRVEQA